jgi:hypothetical protein
MIPERDQSFFHTEDRRLLERVIFPFFIQNPSYKSILFVGCAWYTQRYNRSFEAEKRFITIDPDPDKRNYGAKEHIVDKLENLARHFRPGALDLIICNGVFGWGLNAKADVEQAFDACFGSLREGGMLLLGWNDIEERRPFGLCDCKSLQRFVPVDFPPLQTAVYVTSTPYRHTYNFYEKI